VTAPRIRTTVVGSYPVPEWLLAAPSEQGLIDATRVVIATQEAAGVDVVCDGELYRFDLNHPETNGMIEYFVRPMQGVRYEMTFEEVIAYRALPGMRFRTRPPGVVDGPVASGSLDLPLACQRAAALATKTFKFTVTGPHMLAKTLLDRYYGDTAELAHAIADVLAEQVRHLDADVVQLDEANLPGHPEEWEWAEEITAPFPASRIALVPAGRPADVLPVLGWIPGNWNCAFPAPSPVGFAAVLRSWEERFGARLFVLSHDQAWLLVERPPRDLDAALPVAAEHFVFCDEPAGRQPVRTTATDIAGAPVWYFWWD